MRKAAASRSLTSQDTTACVERMTAVVTASPAGDQSSAERRRRMLALVTERGFVPISELAEVFGVSQVTARADVDGLAARGLARRVRGGALALQAGRNERSFEESQSTGAQEKAAIGRAAAALVLSGQTIVLDVGSTTTAVARALVARIDLEAVTVVTNGLTIALELEAALDRYSVLVTGGTLRRLQHSLVDPMGELILDRLHPDLAFLGCNGIHPRTGVTNVNLPEVAMKARMLAVANRAVVLADGTKVGVTSLARICPVDEVDLLLTGPSADAEQADELRSAGLEVRVVEVPEHDAGA